MQKPIAVVLWLVTITEGSGRRRTLALQATSQRCQNHVPQLMRQDAMRRGHLLRLGLMPGRAIVSTAARASMLSHKDRARVHDEVISGTDV